MKFAFVFPGQGSQAVGMGQELAERFASAKAVLDEVDAALGQDLSGLMANGPIEELTLTENAPPHENIFAQHRPGFFKAPHLEKGARVVVGFCESVFMFFAVEFQSSGVYVSLQP